MGPIHWETNLREAIASLRKVKGRLIGGVLFELLTRVVPQAFLLPAKLKKVSKVRLCENYHPWIRKAKELMQLGFIKCPDQDPWFVRILVTGQGIL